MTKTWRMNYLAAILAMAAVLGPRTAWTSRSHRFLGMCRYYSALAEELGCPRDGYLTKTAAPYCLQFNGLRDRLSQQGVEVLAKIKLCLQQSLERRPGLKCSGVLEVALKSHRTCYRQAQFCRLGFFEQLEVLKVGAPVLSEPAYLQVGHEILADCFDPTEAPSEVSVNGPPGRVRDGLQ